MKNNIYNEIMDTMKTSAWSADMVSNINIINGIIERNIRESIVNGEIKVSQEIVDRLK
jgi:hypothetical protein